MFPFCILPTSGRFLAKTPSLKQNRRTVWLWVALWLACGHPACAQLGGPFGVNPDRPYDQNAFLATHDSYANLQEGYDLLLANHHPAIPGQLNLGVRFVTLRCYLMWQGNGSDYTYYAYPDFSTDDSGQQTINWHYANSLTRIASSTSTRPAEASRGLDIYLAHSPDLGYLSKPLAWNTLRSALQQIKGWVDAHPDQVVTINLDNRNARMEHLMAALVDAGLAPMAFFADGPNNGKYPYFFASEANFNPLSAVTPAYTNLTAFTTPDGTPWDVAKHGWPTLRQLISGVRGSGSKRVVITNDANVSGNGAFHYFLTESRSWQNSAGEGPGVNWVSSVYYTNVTANLISFGPDYSGPLPTFPFATGILGSDNATGPINFNDINSPEFLTRKVELVRNHNHRLPMGIAIDAAGRGDPGTAVERLNLLWEKRRGSA